MDRSDTTIVEEKEKKEQLYDLFNVVKNEPNDGELSIHFENFENINFGNNYGVFIETKENVVLENTRIKSENLDNVKNDPSWDLQTTSDDDSGKNIVEEEQHENCENSAETDTLRRHEDVTKYSRPLTSEICKRGFKVSKNVVLELRTNSAETSYECTICNMKFSLQAHLLAHKRTHSEENALSNNQCSICNKTFSIAGDLRKHWRSHEEKLYECTECHKVFLAPHLFRKHMIIHTGEKPYECTVCDKTFARQNDLHVHGRVHTGEKPYVCTVCHKAFKHNGSLRAHERIHTGGKPYECTECQKTFSQLSSLREHLRIHTGDKPCECPKCHKWFPRLSNLQKHECSHGS